MTDLSDQKLQRILELSESNNRILRSIRRSIIWGRIVHTIYWVVIIGASIGAFWYLRPYLNQLGELYSGLKSGAGSVNAFSSDSLIGFLKNLGR